MNSKHSYSQHCPLAISAEFLCKRWTLLIFREILFGANSFNDISRGVPRMSRSLLSNRLKELVRLKLVVRKEKPTGTQVQYSLSEAGKALEPVVFKMAQWGQEWLKVEPSVKNIDVDFLMWDIRRNAIPHTELPHSFTVHIFLTDVPDNKSEHWLVFDDNEVDLCHVDKNFIVDVRLDVTVTKLAKVWMGWEDFEEEKTNGNLKFTGKKALIDTALKWFGQSSLAHIKKQTSELLI